jgi:hypothetical protein
MFVFALDIDPLADYLTCGDESVSLDIYGLSEFSQSVQRR